MNARPAVSTEPAAPAAELTSAERARRIAAIRSSPTYRLAEDDPAFMESDAARGARLALEFMRAELQLREHHIASTVVVFGGARILPPGIARARLDALEAGIRGGGSAAPGQAQALALARRAVEYSRYYEEARILGADLARTNSRPDCHQLVVVTGGGPGIMEAANRGAAELGAPTIGFNIRLPEEQDPNPYITPGLAFRFHYFALRKMHFLLRARALVAFPGGFGTLDEVFESLNLVHTGVIAPIPVILVGREHWKRLIDFEALFDCDLVDPRGRELIRIVDTGLEAARCIREFSDCA
jgi:uncharacterized protein (TIGR00730 family)